MVGELIYPLTALTLAVRGTISKDVQWKRVVAAVLAVFPLLVPMTGMLPGAEDFRSNTAFARSTLRVYTPVLGGFYLLAWGFMSRDPRWVRMVSAVVGTAAVLPTLVILAIASAVMT